MGTLGIHQDIPASDAELTPRFGIDYISPPLVMEKIIPVNSRVITTPPTMSLLLEVECTPAIIIKPRLMLIMHPDHLSRNKTFD